MKDLALENRPDRTKRALPFSQHGGARPGAGRKPSGRQPVLLRLNPAVISALRHEAARKRQTLSEVAEARLKRRLKLAPQPGMALAAG